MRFHKQFGYILFVTLSFVGGAHAQNPREVLVKISSGTGFFINRNGDVVTNAHVVRNCQSISIHTAAGDLPAALSTHDDAHDLALLHASGDVPAVAHLRATTEDPQIGDTVFLVSFPNKIKLDYSTLIHTTHIIGPEADNVLLQFFHSIASVFGGDSDPDYLQLAHVATSGDSGTPVLDRAGDVIGVVRGNLITNPVDSATHQVHYEQVLDESDVAISLGALKYFLQDNHTLFDLSTDAGADYRTAQLQEKASAFVVPIRCVLGTVN